jgi:hypothetical protein
MWQYRLASTNAAVVCEALWMRWCTAAELSCADLWPKDVMKDIVLLLLLLLLLLRLLLLLLLLHRL